MRFSLRTLLLFTTILVVWLGYQAEQIHRQQAAVAAIQHLHGSVRYDGRFQDDADVANPSRSKLRRWLAQWLGRDAIANIDAVYLGGTEVRDADLICLKKLPRLRLVVLTSTPITDAGLVHLRNLTDLETLDLRFTAVSDAGVAKLRRALPLATIHSKSDIE